MSLRPLFFLACAMGLAGCVESPPPETPREEDRRLERAVQEPLDQARAVEQQVQAAKERQDEEMRAQEE